MRAVVLAGGKSRKEFQAISPEPYVALLPLHGRPMVDYVVTALLAHPRVREVRVVGPPAVVRQGVTYVPPSDQLWDNVARGLEGMPDQEPVVVATADIPLVTTAIVDRFLAKAPDREVVYPVIARQVAEQRFPGVRRTYFRLREGTFTGGNLFLVRPGAVRRAAARARDLLAHRKHPWRLARDIGWGLLLQLVLNRLSLKDVERSAGRLLTIDGAALVCDDPEVGVDVDKPSDYWLVQRVLAARQGAAPHA